MTDEVTLPTTYQQYIHMSRYSRWRDDLGRREHWHETVARYFDFMEELVADNPEARDLYAEYRPDLEKSVLDLEVMPSMRMLMTAGEALKKSQVAGYNCSYVAVDHPRVFDETMYVLMCGTGVGFSVEKKSVEKLPDVSEEFHDTETTIHVKDSKIGWAAAYRELISLLYQGQVPNWDVSRVRPAGARLKTFGGRASGPRPLVKLFEFTVEVFKNAAGRKLNEIECHDLMCKIAEVVVVGGVRRSALISLSNLTDERMRNAKSGQWWVDNKQRALANNSVSYTEKPDMAIFMREWVSLYESKSGERGIFNRVAAQRAASASGRRDENHEFGTNPCSEIILRSKQFCNLSEVVVRPSDNLLYLCYKVKLATILGTLQSAVTGFKYLTRKWTTNTEEERLLGVSLTGIMDHAVLSGRVKPEYEGEIYDFYLSDGITVESTDPYSFEPIPDDASLEDWLSELKEVAVETNREWADALGIGQSTAITCVKPSGTVSQLVDSASGIHPRYSEYYIRTVRADKKDPLATFLIDKGYPHEEDVINSDVWVFSFPMKSPEHSVTRDELSAMDQLKIWDIYQKHWCEHKPSITVYYKDEDFLEIGDWVYKNFDDVSGVSFLPHSDHTYEQAPYQEITKEEYEEAVEAMPAPVDWIEFAVYEEDDNTTSTHELACTGDACELSI